jgi:hypothetical protein
VSIRIYSAFNAMAGSMLAALRAGRKPAQLATAIIRTEAAINEGGSRALT